MEITLIHTNMSCFNDVIKNCCKCDFLLETGMKKCSNIYTRRNNIRSGVQQGMHTSPTILFTIILLNPGLTYYLKF